MQGRVKSCTSMQTKNIGIQKTAHDKAKYYDKNYIHNSCSTSVVYHKRTAPVYGRSFTFTYTSYDSDYGHPAAPVFAVIPPDERQFVVVVDDVITSGPVLSGSASRANSTE